jgi:hypothetical protein
VFAPPEHPANQVSHMQCLTYYLQKEKENDILPFPMVEQKNCGYRTASNQRRNFYFASVMILVDLSLVCFNAFKVQVWSEIKIDI